MKPDMLVRRFFLQGSGVRRSAKVFIGGMVLLLAALYIATFPPLLPSHARVVAAWHPSESWLYDRNGRLIDSERVDFKARRLGW